MPNHASQGSRRRRTLTLLLVVVFHGALIAGVLLAAKWAPRRLTAATPLEIVFLPRQPKSQPSPERPPRRPTAREPAAPKAPAPVPAAPDTESTLITVPAAAAPRTGVDWDREAHIVAAEHAHQEPPPPVPQFGSPKEPKSVFAPPPAHHRGDEEPLAGGGTAVYVSEDCYQVAPAIPVVQNAINNGMGLPIYCNNKSKTPRGDLFDELPAYQKLHPQK